MAARFGEDTSAHLAWEPGPGVKGVREGASQRKPVSVPSQQTRQGQYHHRGQGSAEQSIQTVQCQPQPARRPGWNEAAEGILAEVYHRQCEVQCVLQCIEAGTAQRRGHFTKADW